MANKDKNKRPQRLRGPVATITAGNVTARLDADTMARVVAYAARVGATIKLDIGPSTAAAMLIKEGLAVVESAS